MEEKRLVEMWRVNIVEKEKERLIREHAGLLEGFLHPDLVEKAKRIAGYEGGNGNKTQYGQRFKV